MSWLFSNDLDEVIGSPSSTPFNFVYLEKATSEMIPSGQDDMALNLDICDRIRSKQVPPRNAMRALKKRITHKNPNVVLLAARVHFRRMVMFCSCRMFV